MIYNPEFHLSSLISEMIKVFRKYHYKDLEEKLKKIANDNHVISSQKEMARRDFIQNLEYSLDNITGDRVFWMDFKQTLC